MLRTARRKMRCVPPPRDSEHNRRRVLICPASWHGRWPYACLRRQDSVRALVGQGTACGPGYFRHSTFASHELNPSSKNPPRVTAVLALKTALTSPPFTPGTWSPAALSSYFAPPTWIRPPTTLGGRAAASSHACGLHNINQPFAQARLPHVRPERVSSFSLQCGSGTQRARRDSAASRRRAAVARGA